MFTPISNWLTRNRFLTAVSLGLLIALILTGVAFATLYTISTTDGSVAEWQNQGIPAFQTDPSGDTINGGGAIDDIVKTSVATGDDNKLYFLLETAAGPAVNTANHTAAASIDCNQNGIDQEPDDRLVVYMAHYLFPTGAERITLCYGDQTNCTALGPDAGQQVGNQIEWGVASSDLPANCQNEVGIAFYTADGGNFPATVFDSTSLQGWGIPTAIDLKEMQAQSSATGLIALMALGAVGLLGATAWVWRRRLH